MVFGEIIEPSTRALVDDEYEEYPEYVEPTIEWEGNYVPPAKITHLIFIESDRIVKLFETFTVNTNELCCKLKSGGIRIYKSSVDKYIISYTPKDLSTGQVVEVLIPWIKNSNQIYGITSESTAKFQCADSLTTSESFIRTLSNSSSSNFNYKKLESPNLISGLCASVLTYCIHLKLDKCTLFVVYMDNSPLDSITVGPVTNLMKLLDLQISPKPFNLNPCPSNLYL